MPFVALVVVWRQVFPWCGRLDHFERRAIYEFPLHENLSHTCNDVDRGLKIREKGYLLEIETYIRCRGSLLQSELYTRKEDFSIKVSIDWWSETISTGLRELVKRSSKSLPALEMPIT